jgi:hypothetical protein
MKRYIAVMFLLFISSAVLFAQYGKISGKVTDRGTKETLVGASVILEGTTWGSATDIDGGFVISNVPVGKYNVKATYIGYQSTTITGVTVLDGLTREVNIQLSSTAVEVQSVEIIAQRPLVEKSATNAVRIQSAEDIENLPVRGIEGYFSSQPGVVVQNGMTYIRGSRTEEVGYTIEGASVQDVVGSTVRNNNTSFTNTGSLVTTIPEALEEVNVQSGGFGAEFGGANGGIIGQTFKTGGSQTKVTFQAETDNFGNYPGGKALDTYSYGYSDYVVTLGLPLMADKIKLFVAGENSFIRDQNPTFWTGANFGYQQSLKDYTGKAITTGDSALLQWPGGNVPGAMNNRYTTNGTLLFNFQPVQVRLGGAFTWSRNQDDNLLMDIFNEGSNDVTDNSNLLLNGKITYSISQKTFAEVSVNYVDERYKSYVPCFGDNLAAYGDSVSAAQQGWLFPSLTSAPFRYNFSGFTFLRPGDFTNDTYAKDERSHIGFTGAISSELQSHSLKIGGSFEYWTISHYAINPGVVYTNMLADPNVTRDPAGWAKTLRSLSVNNYGFDEFGNPITNGTDAPKHPFYGAAYIQDKMEMSDIIINFGLRFDAIYLDDWNFNKVSDLGYNTNNFTLDTPKKGSTFAYLEPRVGFSFPATDRTTFHMQYGVYVQGPPLYAAYRSQAVAVHVFENGNYYANPIGYNLQPEKTVSYEIGFAQQFSDVAALDVTGFYKNVDGQLQVNFFPQPAGSAPANFFAYSNGDFTNVMGLELSLRIRRTNRLQAQVNYTLQDARGTNSFANSAVALVNVQGSAVKPSMVIPLDYENAHRGTVSIDYRWDKGEGGPILERLGINLQFTFNSGHPFTQATGSGGQQETDLGNVLNDADARTRFPLGPIANSITPWVYQLDLRIDKSFSIGSLDVNIYCYVQNLLNTQNVLNVYYRTGNAYDDGYLTDPSQSATTLQQYGSMFSQLYNVINLQNSQNQFRSNGFNNFGTPRQLRVGAKLEF